MQMAAGLMCVALGCLHFSDRARSAHEVRSFYLGSLIPKTSRARGSIAVIEVVCGFVLLFTA